MHIEISAAPKSASARLFAAFMTWDAFVAAFIYYTLLTLIMIAVADVAAGFVLVAYLLPPAALAVVLVHRGVQALAALPIDIAHTPAALLN
jgi:hypothetical protein